MNYFHEHACYDQIGVSYILKTCRLNRDYVSTANDIENDQHHNRIYFLTFSALNKLCWHELHSPKSTWHITRQLYTCFISKYSHCYGGLGYIMIKQNLPQYYRYKYTCIYICRLSICSLHIKQHIMVLYCKGWQTIL